MKKQFFIVAIASIFIGMTSCNDDTPTPQEETETKYLLQTMSAVENVKPGFMSSYAELPSGVISNINQATSVQGEGNEGWRTYNGMVFKIFGSTFAQRGIFSIKVGADGKITYGQSIQTSSAMNGSGNFVIENDTKGYYWDADDPWSIQTFNPTTVRRTGKLNEDFESKLKKNNAGIAFQGIGQNFLAIKKGKLYANITYSKVSTVASGMFNDFFDYVDIAVIDLTTGKYEKTITIENTKSIAFINDNEMYSFDTNGDLYIVCQGGINADQNGALGGKSKIVRIKADETDIDSTWELNFSEYNTSDQGKFTGVLARNGRLIVTTNQVPLTPGPTGNINNGEIWKFYSVDVASKQFTAIQGVEHTTNAGGAYAAFELDGKILLRVDAPSKGISGFYELNGHQATQVFRVAEGRATGLTKINVTQ